VLLDEFQIPKLCDFGLSRVMDSAQTQAMTMQIGTPAYMAPELMTGQAGTAPSSPSSQLASPHVSSPGILAHPDTSAEGKSDEDIGSEEEGRAPPDARGALPPSSPPCTTRTIQGHVRLARENSISILNRLTDIETSKAGGGTMLSSSGIKTSSGGAGKQASSSRAQSRKIDVYSFGILLWSFWTRRHPYADKGLNTFQLIRQVADEGLRPTITAEDMPAERSTSETGERVQLTPEERQRRKATQVGLRRSRCMCGLSVRARDCVLHSSPSVLPGGPLICLLFRRTFASRTSHVQKLAGLICQCWSREPELRPEFTEIAARLEALRLQVVRGAAYER
jgi:serine/threonine protein kinase